MEILKKNYVEVPRLDLIWQGGEALALVQQGEKKCNQCNDCAPPPTNTIQRFQKDFRAMSQLTNTIYNVNFEFWVDTRQVLIPCSTMSHIHFVPLGIFIPSDFPYILVGSTILQQTRQKRSSPIMTQCQPASRNATGLLLHRHTVQHTDTLLLQRHTVRRPRYKSEIQEIYLPQTQFSS